MKTAISIPDELFQKAEGAAKSLSISRSELYQRALAAFLDRQEGRLVTEALNEIYGTDAEAEAVDPLLERLQLASLPLEEW